MFSFIVSAGDVRQGGMGMRNSSFPKHRDSRIAGGQGVGNLGHAPGTAQVEAVEVYDLGVAAVGDVGRGEEVGRFLFWQIRQPVVEPPDERVPWQDTEHQRRLLQGGREEVITVGLPAGRSTPVVKIIIPAALHDQLFQLLVAALPGIV